MPLCYSCSSLHEQAKTLNVEHLLADRVRIANYAIKFDQMYRVMDGYKRDRQGAKDYQETLKYVLGDTLNYIIEQLGCYVNLLLGEFLLSHSV